MGQPIPPGDNVPLYEGLDSSWNDFVSAIPEEKRSAFAEQVQGIHKQYEPLKQWEDLAKSGITPDHASTALNVYSVLENRPQEVYDTLAKYLNITPQQAEKVVEAVEENDGTDPIIQQLQHKIDTIGQVMLAERNQSVAQKQQAEMDAAIDREMNALKKKYSDVNEEEVVMRALQKGLTLEQAYQDYTSFVTEVRRRPSTPMIMGGGGSIPQPGIDVKKLDSAGAKSLVAQMFTHSNAERKA
jgi:hypothetical protein